MANRKQPRENEKESPARRELGGQATTGGSKPGGAPTGLRHESGITSGGAAAPLTEGAPPSGAIGGSGTGAGGLGTGPAGAGGTRNLVHGAGRPSYGPAPHPATETDVALPTDDTAPLGQEHSGALSGEASSRTGSASAEPGSAPSTTVRGAGSGRR